MSKYAGLVEDDKNKELVTNKGTGTQGSQDEPVYYEPTSGNYPQGTSPGLGKDYAKSGSGVSETKDVILRSDF